MNIENLLLSDVTPLEGDDRLYDLQSELAQASATSAVGALAASLAHELNQPLTAIVNYVETARDLLNADADAYPLLREALAEAASQSLRAGQVVRRLRDFIARAGTERSACSLKALIAETMTLAPLEAGLAEVTVRVKLDAASDSIFADQMQVQQVLLNLIRNAIEALEDAPVKRLDIMSRTISEDQIEIMVADSGHGIAAQSAATLFEPFRSSRDSGMGLGLSICRTIIEEHGGAIRTQSSELGGAAFCFTLPRTAAPNA